MTLEEDIHNARLMRDYYKGKVDATNMQYSGTRPSWVSAELAQDQAIVDQYDKRLSELLSQQEQQKDLQT